MDIDFQLINKVLVAIIDLAGVWLAFWVYLADRKKTLNRGFALFVIPVLLWINFYNLAFWADQHDVRLLMIRLTFASAFIFLISFYYFVVVWFLEEKGRYLFYGKVIIVFEVVFGFLCAFTGLIIKDLTIGKWGIIPVFSTVGTIIFHLSTTVLAFFIIWRLIVKYPKLSQHMRHKVQFFLIGVFTFVGGVFFFGVILPFVFNASDYYHIANYFLLPLLGFTAYAIVKQELFDIKIIATQVLTVLIWIILLAKLFTNQSTTELVTDSAILALMMIFGILLIRIVTREVKHREKLQELAQKLKEMDKRKDEFISVAAHELRSPLTAIKGYLSMVIEGDGGKIGEKARGFLSDASAVNERLIRLVNNMLNVSRIEEGKLVYQMEEVSLIKATREIYNSFIFEAKRKKLDFSVDVPDGTMDKVYLDPDRVREVVGNLVSNAIKFTEEGSVMIKMFNPNEDKIRVEIIDTGSGITKEEQEKLFRKFYRASSTEGKTMGTGLGLYITKLLVKKFGGRIGLVSEFDKGSTFWFELPLAIMKPKSKD